MLYWDFLGRIWYFRRTDFLSRRAVESLTAAALNQSCQALATAVRSRLAWRLFPKTRRICNPHVDSRFVPAKAVNRSEEHTSELQSLMRISYAVFCLKKKTRHNYAHNQ